MKEEKYECPFCKKKEQIGIGSIEGLDGTESIYQCKECKMLEIQ